MNKTLLSATSRRRSLRSISAASGLSATSRDLSLPFAGTGGFEKVAPDGELKHGKLSDQKYSNKADTYGQILALTRHDIITMISTRSWISSSNGTQRCRVDRRAVLHAATQEHCVLLLGQRKLAHRT